VQKQLEQTALDEVHSRQKEFANVLIRFKEAPELNPVVEFDHTNYAKVMKKAVRKATNKLEGKRALPSSSEDAGGAASSSDVANSAGQVRNAKKRGIADAGEKLAKRRMLKAERQADEKKKVPAGKREKRIKPNAPASDNDPDDAASTALEGVVATEDGERVDDD